MLASGLSSEMYASSCMWSLSVLVRNGDSLIWQDFVGLYLAKNSEDSSNFTLCDLYAYITSKVLFLKVPFEHRDFDYISFLWHTKWNPDKEVRLKLLFY